MSTSDKKSIIIDSSSLILLYKAALLDIFISSYKVSIPQAVDCEITQKDHTGADHFVHLCEKGMLNIIDNNGRSNRFADSAINSLDQGERSVIYEYLQGNFNFIVLDDKKGIKYCYNNSIPFINAILVCRILYLNNSIDPLLYTKSWGILSSIGRYSDRIKGYAKNADVLKLKDFMPNKY